jgi:hypothetical protein
MQGMVNIFRRIMKLNRPNIHRDSPFQIFVSIPYDDGILEAIGH